MCKLSLRRRKTNDPSGVKGTFDERLTQESRVFRHVRFKIVVPYSKVVQDKTVKIPLIIDQPKKIDLVNTQSGKVETSVISYNLILWDTKNNVIKKRITVIKDTAYPDARIESKLIDGEISRGTDNCHNRR